MHDTHGAEADGAADLLLSRCQGTQVLGVFGPEVFLGVLCSHSKGC